MFWEKDACGCRAAHTPRTLSRRMAQLAAGILTPALIALALGGPVHAQETTHVIVPGDNLTRVAQKYNVEPAHLAAYNNLTDPNHIELGQSLKIPAATDLASMRPEATAASVARVDDTVATTDGSPSAGALTAPVVAPIVAPAAATLPGNSGYHAVKVGESLTGIAQRYGLSNEDLMRLNGLTDANHVLAGQVLRLTAKIGTMPGFDVSEPALAATIYVVQEGDTLSNIAQDHRITVDQLLRDNGLPHEEYVYVGQRLRIEAPSYVAKGLDTSQAPANGTRKIVIDLSDQTLTAYQGNVAVMHTYVSTGKASTPTVTGEFNIYLKYESQRMTGPDYDLEGVPWVMYYDGDFGIHGAYWHNAFGVPTSHGCTNMRPDEAKALYEWADMGTRVEVVW